MFASSIEYQKLNRNVLETKNNITMVWFNPRHRKHKKYNDTQQIPGYICAFVRTKKRKWKKRCRIIVKALPSQSQIS